MTANGTPITTPTNPNTNQPSNTHKNITIELIPSVLFMIYGIKILFSVHWISR